MFVILLIFIYVFFYFYHYNQSNPNSNAHNNMDKEKFDTECWTFGDDYNSCYSNSNCTVGFLSDGSTHCTKKFLNENI